MDQSNINALLALGNEARKILVQFERAHLTKYESELGLFPKKNRILGIKKKIQYTFDMPEKVVKLLQDLGMCLDRIMMLLSYSIL